MIQENFNLRPYNTFGIEVFAKRFSAFASIAELKDLLDQRNNDPLLFLGGGSNILFTENFDGLVLRNELKGIEQIDENDSHVIIKSGAGEVWHDFVLFCVENNYGGVENLSLIPGSVGASPMQNIGAYGVEIKNVFVSLEALHIESGKIHSFDNLACEFGYRESVFKRKLKNQYVITSVTFKLTKQHTINSSYGAIETELEQMGITSPTIKNISDAVIAIRSSKLPNPAKIGNAGSFFKNPVVEVGVLKKIQEKHENIPNYPAPNGKVKLAAGWLIDQAGWKGKTFDTFGVHKLQALVLVNYSTTEGSDIYDLSTKIIADIKQKFGVELEREVNIH
ncbi:MAG: UDP-N-acetylmuramate dehydrogenase [Crocinitomicaceae bacterium]|nr:UDP-N-acetylmuramate dehydrogenase [Flavobacteriales bacterium]NQZ37527.1 UDP-N-acetylmuramate dehydrogenase [Crocinitomicaceae bacterium]